MSAAICMVRMPTHDGGREECSHTMPCPIHGYPVKDKQQQVLRISIDLLDELNSPRGYLTTAGNRLVDMKKAVASMKREHSDRLRLAIDIALRDITLVEAELASARVALLEEVQS